MFVIFPPTPLFSSGQAKSCPWASCRFYNLLAILIFSVFRTFFSNWVFSLISFYSFGPTRRFSGYLERRRRWRIFFQPFGTTQSTVGDFNGQFLEQWRRWCGNYHLALFPGRFANLLQTSSRRGQQLSPGYKAIVGTSRLWWWVQENDYSLHCSALMYSELLLVSFHHELTLSLPQLPSVYLRVRLKYHTGLKA